MFGKNPAPKQHSQVEQQQIRFLGYALPRAKDDEKSRIINGNGFVIHDEPLGAPVSFQSYDGVILFAGSFEDIERLSYQEIQLICKNSADLDHREREFFTSLGQDVPFIFLVPNIRQTEHYEREDKLDLFRRIIRKFGINWRSQHAPNPALESNFHEFRQYIKQHGCGYVHFGFDKSNTDLIKPVCVDGGNTYGLIIGSKVFALPCTVPATVDQVQKMSTAAVEAVIQYRRRTSKELPDWALSFAFSSETALRTKADAQREELAALDAQIDGYTNYKGALVFQSDPLVEIVCDIFNKFLGLGLTVDDKCIEDATLRNENNSIDAVFEIKGVKGNFSRGNVNQIDSHRERLGLPANAPGILIMNTFMEATTLKDKDQAPHPDIIKKAVADSVLMIRTLDLLRFADAVERGVIKKDEMRRLILNESGWLRVEGDMYKVAKG